MTSVGAPRRKAVTVSLHTKILRTTICCLDISGKSPMDLRIPALKIKIISGKSPPTDLRHPAS